MSYPAHSFAPGKAVACLFVLLLAPVALMSVAFGQQSRLATYQHDDETYYALSLQADLQKEQPADVIVLVDTSASQTNAYRDDSVVCLKSLLAGLSSKDRVRICAVDLDRVAFHKGFVTKDASEISTALNGLDQRAPLGSTDMVRVLQDIANEFPPSSDRARQVVYIGDGISRGNLLAQDEFQAMLTQLVDNRISISSYAIGPQRDLQFLAALANQTGGNIFIDNPQSSAQQAGDALAESCHAEVFWPQRSSLSEGFDEVFPAPIPPIRADRDSIIIGTLSSAPAPSATIGGIVGNKPRSLTWEFTPEASNDDFSHLPKLVALARRDGGQSLPTVGSAGMREARRSLLAGAEELTKLGGQALAVGDLDGAERMADAAMRQDPTNPQAHVIQNAVKKKGTSDANIRLAQVAGSAIQTSPAEVTETLVQDGITLDGGPIVLETAPTDGVILEGNVIRPAYGDPPPEFDAESGRLIDAVELRRRAREGALRAEVRTSLGAARRGLRENPTGTVRDLKILLDGVNTTPDVSDDVRTELRSLVQSAIQEGTRRQIEKEERDALSAESRARAQERADIVAATQRKEEQLKTILNRFNYLMRQGQYEMALETALIAEETHPEQPEAIAASLTADFASRYHRLIRIRRLRERGFTLALMSVEEAAIPFPDDPPLIYPPKEEWEAITARRKKYASADLSSINPSEQRILDSLDDATEFEFFETPLEEAIQYLKDRHEIEIQIDNAALDTLGLDSSLPITKTLAGISLRSALRLILGENDLTYVVRDEVLMITSQEEAEEALTTRVYPVGDLVLPITSGGGGIGGVGGIGGGGIGGQLNGGGLGGGGGGFGGGGGGFGGGGGGGGFGGGGGGFGGGGQFQIADPLVIGEGSNVAGTADRSHKEATPQEAPPRTIDVQPAQGETLRSAWMRFFQTQRTLADEQQVRDQDIRETVAVLFEQKKFAETADVIQAALVGGFPQPWMFESLGLALQAQGAPLREIERAVMSAVDLTSNIDELFYAAVYMGRIGLEQRALVLLRDIAERNPNRTEPLALALQLARKTNDPSALRWSALAVARHAWPENQQDFADQALRTAKAMVIKLQQDGKPDEAAEFQKQIDEATVRDCYATITWSGEADLDLLVQEPGGTVCSLREPRTTSGGVLLGDASSLDDSAASVSETYICPEGFDGDYRLLVRPIWGTVNAGKVTVEVTTHKGSDQEQTIRKQLPIDKDPVVVQFQLQDGRRDAPLDEQLVATSVQNQLAVNRAILAQQLSHSAGSEASQALAVDRRRLANGLLGSQFRSAVGFRPVVTPLPEGTTLSITAVISADRRYVRITPSPLFSGVTDVFTFNFANGDTGGGTDPPTPAPQ